MRAQTLSDDTTVVDALRTSPAIGSVLLSMRTACVGCYLARFCTLSDISKHYRLPWQAFIDKLRRVQSDFDHPKGESNA
jgi:Fe-S cluster biogenesis protein NfuA